ncbi:MAG TPA: copper-binding protein [Pyrinomonadaceae bacterium]|nr:copper-binding protein [Pyrinomonadaceae bacterium]
MRRAWPIHLAAAVLATVSLCCQKQPAPRSEPPAAQATPPAGPAGFPPAVMNKQYPGTGVVVLINRKEGWIEINHEDIKDLMPAMQMEFNVKDKTLLDRAAVGDRVDFTVIETPQGEYLIDLKKKQ